MVLKSQAIHVEATAKTSKIKFTRRREDKTHERKGKNEKEKGI